MPKSQTMIKLAAIAALLALGACSSGVKLDDTSKNATGGAAAGADTRNVTPVDVSRDELTDPNSPLAKRSVYFDFDSYAVKPEYQGLLTQHARYLQSHNQRKVLIQGNTDERGTSEYNLALGQKRAEAVRRALSSLGVPDSQMESVSLGKEKPQASGHDEESWAQNRRSDIVY
ncbi:peptidoglycan-associated lipoprotein Pal [Ralstonia pseudosolanacearum]|uniref:Peptidoglycan-associated lipoprotein n=1 Tax=Ralstonia solanacearum TaxID=305 RepID=A0A0S4TUL9_RALSL|nr:peptidoglycan-associated lipoprotein Pal [Ralstonia pseudosolanacearum]OAI79536.1 membrane protein [Ralstonia solanacearum]QCX47751.1 peptidoglycan-associated lipoprotein Pal [Ralstonia pseudosolanacearum]CUV13183.1 Peptidoglycan-associated lipoprotein [Ralstonia solanacearum]